MAHALQTEPAERPVIATERLIARREEIQQRWLELISETYPEDTARFLRTQRDPFTNPLGATLRRGTGQVLAAIGSDDREALLEGLDAIVRIRSVQDFSPAEALRAVALLEVAAREVLADELEEAGLSGLEALHRTCSEVLLAAFEVYARCREQLFEVRLHEALRHRAVELNRTARAEQRRLRADDEGSNRPDGGKGGATQ